MKTKRTVRQPALTPDRTIPAPSIEAGRSAEPSDRPVLASVPTDTPSETIERLTLPLRKDGTIALDSLRQSTKDKLTTALKDPALGKITGTPSSADAALDEHLCGVLYSASSSLLVLIGRRAGYSTEQASVLAFTPEEVQSLTPVTTKVINKWLPATGGYQDEIMLGLALTAIVSGKMALLRKQAKIVPMPVAEQQQPETADVQ